MPEPIYVCEVTAPRVPVNGTPRDVGSRCILPASTARRYEARGWVTVLDDDEPKDAA